VLLPFIKKGIERGEKAFHIVDPDLREKNLERLRSASPNGPGNRTVNEELRNKTDPCPLLSTIEVRYGIQ
jgi:hypothetical protein